MVYFILCYISGDYTILKVVWKKLQITKIHKSQNKWITVKWAQIG